MAQPAPTLPQDRLVAQAVRAPRVRAAVRRDRRAPPPVLAAQAPRVVPVPADQAVVAAAVVREVVQEVVEAAAVVAEVAAAVIEFDTGLRSQDIKGSANRFSPFYFQQN